MPLPRHHGAGTSLDGPIRVSKLPLLCGRYSPSPPLGSTGRWVSIAHAEKVLIYYTGKRALLLAALHLSTLFLSCFCVVVAAPAVGFQTSSGAFGFTGGARGSPSLVHASFLLTGSNCTRGHYSYGLHTVHQVCAQLPGAVLLVFPRW